MSEVSDTSEPTNWKALTDHPCKLIPLGVRPFAVRPICQNVQRAINTSAADKLRKLTLEADIAGKFVVDYRLIAPVLFTDGYLEILNKGEVRWKTDSQSQIPYLPDPIPAWTDHSNMFYLWLTEYTPKTLAYAAHTHNYLQYELSADKLPDQQKVYLSTTCPGSACAGTLIPKLGENYPDSTVIIKIVSREVPQVNITTEGLGLKLFVGIDLSTATVPSIISANVSVSLLGTVNVRGDRIIGHISKFSTIIESITSKVGDIDLPTINNALAEGLELLALPEMNAIADVGVSLPLIPDLNFRNLRIIYLQKAVLIGTDVQFQGIA